MGPPYEYPPDELIDDFRLACVSRAIDDRQISMQKQSRVFFQISGAGHEALRPRPSPATSVRATTGSSPTTGTRPSCSGSAWRPRTSCCRPSGRPRTRPAVAARCPATGARPPSTSSPSRAPPAASASRPWGAPRRPGTSCGGRSSACRAHGDELTYVSLGEGACSEGEFWESLNTACNLHLPVLYVVPDNGFAISVPVDRPAARPRRRPGGAASAASTSTASTARTTSASRRAAKAIVERVRAGTGPALLHCDVVRPYSHSAADTQAKYRSADELADEAAPRPAS